MELRAHGVVPGAINIPVGYVNEGGRTFQPQNFQPYSRVRNKSTPLNKRSPWKIWQKNKGSPIYTLYLYYSNRLYEVRNKAVAPRKKSKNE